MPDHSAIDVEKAVAAMLGEFERLLLQLDRELLSNMAEVRKDLIIEAVDYTKHSIMRRMRKLAGVS